MEQQGGDAEEPAPERRPTEVELTVERLAAGGDGVGRAPDGRVVFVPWVAPGDRVRVRLVEERPRYARGVVEALLEPGASRTDPLCAVFGACGGCHWQHVDYGAQLAAKEAILRDALARVGGLAAPERVAVRPSPSPYGYRARARVVVQGGRVGFRRRRSSALCATARCPVLVPALDAALEALAADPPADGELELAAGDEGDVRTVSLGAGARGPALLLRAPGTETRLRVSPGVFVQASALLRQELGEAVLEASGRGERLLELHAGAGFFTLGLARRFASLVAVEADARAVRDLRENLGAAGARHVRVVRAPAERFLARAGGTPLDAVVLDPPRTGLGRGAAARLARLGARRIVYVSCDPATWARDLAVLARGGYTLARAEGFDLFPQTPHVEALALLTR